MTALAPTKKSPASAWEALRLKALLQVRRAQFARLLRLQRTCVRTLTTTTTQGKTDESG